MVNMLSITSLVLHNQFQGYTPSYFSRDFLEFFLNLYIPPWLWKCFNVIVLRLLQYICDSKKSICSFLIMPSSKTLPQVLKRELLNFPEQRFLKIFFLKRKEGGDYGVERITNINKGIGHKF